MLKPPPSGTIPGVTDTLDFVKNLWGSMNIPGAGMSGMGGMASPPMSVEDLDKRIADMKAVESWLNLNLSMLRGTIQAMEVQRSTLVTLKSMGASMAEAMRQSGVSAEKMANTPFASFFGQPAGPSAATGAAKPGGPSGASAQPGTSSAPGAAAGSAPGADAGAATGMPAAMAWWNMLQDQFTQAVATAMTPPSAAPASDGKEAGKPATPSQPQAQAQSAPADATPEAGNGKGRGGKPKTDKG